MKLVKAAIFAGLSAGAMLALQSAAQAQSVEEFYKGKTITLEISAAPGGSSDFFGRQLAMFMGKHVPGNPEVVPVNKPGAGGMVAAAYLQKNAPKDGTVISFLQRNNLYRSLVDGDDKFDPRDVNWLGSMNGETYVITAWTSSSPVLTAEEMFTKEMILGSTGFGNENRTMPAIMNEYMGTKFKIIHGYTGSEEVGIAMERGEVQGKAATINNLTAGNEAQWIKEGKLKVIFQMAWKNHPAFPDVPNFSNYVTDPEKKAVVDFFVLPLVEAGRPLAMPKGVPDDRVAALRKAFVDTMQDPDFIAHMKGLNSDLDLVTGERIEEIVAGFYATPESVLTNVRAILKAKDPNKK